jgi:hypothetical protein
MTIIRAFLIFLACIADSFRFQDYQTLGRNGAIRQMIGGRQ